MGRLIDLFLGGLGVALRIKPFDFLFLGVSLKAALECICIP